MRRRMDGRFCNGPRRQTGEAPKEPTVALIRHKHTRDIPRAIVVFVNVVCIIGTNDVIMTIENKTNRAQKK